MAATSPLISLFAFLKQYLRADCLENIGHSTSYNPMGLHFLLYGIALHLNILSRKLRSWLNSIINTELVGLTTETADSLQRLHTTHGSYALCF
jgi:hypothetical protein